MTVTTGQSRSGAAPSAASGRAGILGLVVLTTGLFLLREAIAESHGHGFTFDGPWLWPLVVTAGWVVLAVVYLLREVVVPSWVSRHDADDISAARMRWTWQRPGGLLAALVGYSLVVEYTDAGYILATAAFFVVATRLLDSRHLLRDVVVGVAVPIVIYLGFTRMLDIPLPQGVVPL